MSLIILILLNILLKEEQVYSTIHSVAEKDYSLWSLFFYSIISILFRILVKKGRKKEDQLKSCLIKKLYSKNFLW